MAFDWYFEAEKIRNYVREVNSINIKQLNDILVALFDYEGKFDLETVHKFLEKVELTDKLIMNEVKFFKAIKEDKKRV